MFGVKNQKQPKVSNNLYNMGSDGTKMAILCFWIIVLQLLK